MKTKFNQLRKRVPVLVLAGAVTMAGAALAFTNKSLEKVKSGPGAVNVPVDENSVPRGALP